MNLLLDDSKRNSSLEPLSRFHSFFEWNLGGMTLLEKLERKYPGAKIHYKGPNEDFETLIFNRYPHVIPANLDSYDSIYSADSFLPWELLGTVTSIIEDTLTIEKEWKRFRQKYKAKQSGFHIVGKDKHLYIHAGATVYPGVVFDTTHGPILIEDGVKISSFSFLEGPLFVGKNSQIDNARITGGTLIGNQCRIGGEVENSIILDYTNKHHEGFLGHSFVSNWVNLGALSTTSDLKNNYGIVKLKIGDSVVNTGTIKFGSIIGPFTKLAIGVMSNTGTVFDIASNIVESRIQGYVPPFTWIKPGGLYRLEEFLFDTKKIMARRSINLFEFEDFYLRKLYGKCTE